jgi:hypothetical protein
MEGEGHPPEVSQGTYASYVYCNAPVHVDHIVGRALVDALVAVASLLHEGVPTDHIQRGIAAAISEIEELMHEQYDESIATRHLRAAKYSW